MQTKICFKNLKAILLIAVMAMVLGTVTFAYANEDNNGDGDGNGNPMAVVRFTASAYIPIGTTADQIELVVTWVSENGIALETKTVTDGINWQGESQIISCFTYSWTNEENLVARYCVRLKKTINGAMVESYGGECSVVNGNSFVTITSWCNTVPWCLCSKKITGPVIVEP